MSAARDLGVCFIGVCCGGAPHHLRAMAEALGRTVPESGCSPDLARHAIRGEEKFTRAKDRERYATHRKIMRTESEG